MASVVTLQGKALQISKWQSQTSNIPLSIIMFQSRELLSGKIAKCSRSNCGILFFLTFHTCTQQQETPNRLLTRHSMAVKVISYGLLELMIRRSFLESLIKEMSQVLIQFSSCRKYIKQNALTIGLPSTQGLKLYVVQSQKACLFDHHSLCQVSLLWGTQQVRIQSK